MVAAWNNRVGSARTITNSHLIPYVDSKTAAPEVADALNTLPFERNIFKLLANSPPTFIPFMKLLSSCWSEDTALRVSEWQIIVLRTASLLDAPYEWDVNEPVARILRFDTKEKLEAIRQGDLSGNAFTDRHRLIADMVHQMVHDNRVSEETMLRAKNMLGDQATQEVLMIQGVYALLARLMNSCMIDFDPPIEGLEEMLKAYNAKAIEKEKQLEAND